MDSADQFMDFIGSEGFIYVFCKNPDSTWVKFALGIMNSRRYI